MTVEAYYLAHVEDGRAALESDRWIVRRLTWSGCAEYWHCEGAALHVQVVDPALDVSVLKRFRDLGGRPRGNPPCRFRGVMRK